MSEGFLHDRPMPPVLAMLGCRIRSAGGGRADLTFVTKPEFGNLLGGVQGGIVAAMLDGAASCALLADLAPNQFAPSLELKTSFLRPVPFGEVNATGRVLHRGRSIAFLEATLLDGDAPLAVLSATAKIVTR